MAPLLNPYSSLRRMISRKIIRRGFLSLHRGLFDAYHLKAENQMLWVQKMNAIDSVVTELVNAEMIYN